MPTTNASLAANERAIDGTVRLLADRINTRGREGSCRQRGVQIRSSDHLSGTSVSTLLQAFADE